MEENKRVLKQTKTEEEMKRELKRTELSGHTKPVDDVHFLSDSTYIVSTGKDKAIRKWDSRTGRALATQKTGREIFGLLISVDDKDMFGLVESQSEESDNDRIVKWTAWSNCRVFQFDAGYDVSDIALSKDGTRLLVANSDGVHTRDASNGQSCMSIDCKNAVRSACFSDDGKRLVAGDAEGTVGVWDAETGQKAWSSAINPNRHHVPSVSFHSSGRFVLSNDPMTATVTGSSAVDGSCLFTKRDHTSYGTRAMFSPDGATFISGSYDKTVLVYDTASTDCIARLPQGNAAWKMAFSRDSKLIATACENTVFVWDINQRNESIQDAVMAFGDLSIKK